MGVDAQAWKVAKLKSHRSFFFRNEYLFRYAFRILDLIPVYVRAVLYHSHRVYATTLYILFINLASRAISTYILKDERSNADVRTFLPGNISDQDDNCKLIKMYIRTQ